MTDTTKFNGWVCYDADCAVCTRLAGRFRTTLARRHFALAPLQSPWVRRRLNLAEPALLAELRLLRPDGQSVGGAEALLEIGREFWWARPFRQLARLPFVLNLFRAAYRWIARHRHCAAGACSLQGSGTTRARRAPRLADLLPLLLLPLLALYFRPCLAPWIFMWNMAFALYAGCKWLDYRLAVKTGRPANWRRRCGCLLGWPGMDAAEFLNPECRPPIPAKTEWAFAASKTIFGIILLWGLARTALPAHPLLAGWLGMIGAVFILHFGTFHLLSLAWRRAEVMATPLMQNPLLATSLTDFWGGRWNTSFNQLALRFMFRPLRRRTTPVAATLGVFGLSGIIHEIVISLPAHGGYGLPTLYFLAQGACLVAERSRLGRVLGLGRGPVGWLFTVLVTAGPAFWLFHPPFITHVILPMLTAIGAT